VTDARSRSRCCTAQWWIKTQTAQTRSRVQTVEKIIKPPDPTEPEKAQIAVEGAEELYREVRIHNVLKDENGDEVALKAGAKVDVTIEADVKDTTKKISFTSA
jgi:hypothetical protein